MKKLICLAMFIGLLLGSTVYAADGWITGVEDGKCENTHYKLSNDRPDRSGSHEFEFTNGCGTVPIDILDEYDYNDYTWYLVKFENPAPSRYSRGEARRYKGWIGSGMIVTDITDTYLNNDLIELDFYDGIKGYMTRATFDKGIVFILDGDEYELSNCREHKGSIYCDIDDNQNGFDIDDGGKFRVYYFNPLADNPGEHTLELQVGGKVLIKVTRTTERPASTPPRIWLYQRKIR